MTRTVRLAGAVLIALVLMGHSGPQSSSRSGGHLYKVLRAPDTSSLTLGIQEAIDDCGSGDCTIELGPGTWEIPMTCDDSDGSAAFTSPAGKAALEIDGLTNVTLRGAGMNSTFIRWQEEFDDVNCLGTTPGTPNTSGVAAALLRIDNGARWIQIEDLRLEMRQEELTETDDDEYVRMNTVEIGGRGGEARDVTFTRVHFMLLQSRHVRDSSAAVSHAIFMGQTSTLTDDPDSLQIYVTLSRIHSSDWGAKIRGAYDVRAADNWFGNIDVNGYGCHNGSISKRDGTFTSIGNTYEYRITKSNGASDCYHDSPGSASQFRFAHLDSRGSRDFPGQWAKFINDTYIVAGPTVADEFLEGFYMTGYSHATILGNTFLCSDSLSDDTADDVGCSMKVIQLDDREDIASTPCDSDTPCNWGNLIADNYFYNFEDQATYTGAGSPHCPIVLDAPTTATDNVKNVIRGNVFKIANSDGTLDTSADADGFCSNAFGTQADADAKWLDNYIGNNYALGQSEVCLEGTVADATLEQECKLTFDYDDFSFRVDEALTRGYEVTEEATSDTLTDDQVHEGIITNAGASGGITLTLPPVEVGLCFTVYLVAADDVHIDPDASDTIHVLADADGEFIGSDATIGSFVELCGLDATGWYPRSYAGTWTEETP